MNRLIGFSLSLFLSLPTFAMQIGDNATLSRYQYHSFSGFPLATSERSFEETWSVTNIWDQSAFTWCLPDTNSGQCYFWTGTNRPEGSNTSEFLKLCVNKGAKVETVTTQAGTFTACHQEWKENFTHYDLYESFEAPFDGIVKETETYSNAGETVINEWQLKSFVVH